VLMIVLFSFRLTVACNGCITGTGMC
jgi:hypothetical protein